MAYDPDLLAALRAIAQETFPDLEEKRMFGGYGYFINGNYAFGASTQLVVRVGPARYQEALAQPEATPMDITGRPMKGWVFVDPSALANREALRAWTRQGVDFASTLPPK